MPDMPDEGWKPLAYQLDGQGGGRRLEASEIGAAMTEKPPLWVHLYYTNARDQKWLTESSGLDPLVIEALLAEDTRPRTTVIGDGVLIALRGVNLTPGADPDDMVAIRLWIDKNRIISSRERPLLSVADLVEQINNGIGPKSTADFIVELADRLVWRMNDTVDSFEDRVADLEERILETGSSSLRSELSTLRRQVITLRRYLAPERDALSQLIMGKVSWLDDGNRLQLRETSDGLIRHIEDLDAVRERAAVTQEELLSHLSEQMNARMYVLSLVAAIFLPLGFFTGLLGVNVGGIPGTNYPKAFLIFIVLMLVVVIAQIMLFRWKKWL